MQRLFLIAAGLLSLAPSLSALESGLPLRVGTSSRLGPLAVGLTTQPVGAFDVTHAANLDLFILAGRFSEKPGLHLLPACGRSSEGVPIFGRPDFIPLPGVKGEPPGPLTLIEKQGEIFSLMVSANGRGVECGRFERKEKRFAAFAQIKLPELPNRPVAITAVANADGSIELIMGLPDGTPYRSTDPDWRDPHYVPYDGTGRWQGGYPCIAFYAVTVKAGLANGEAGNFRKISFTDREILLRGGSLTPLTTPNEFVAGSWFGDLYYYRSKTGADLAFAPKEWLRDPAGNVLIHPTCGGVVAAYPSTDGKSSDLLVGGEGALYFYRASGVNESTGTPVFAQPVLVMQEAAELYAGSLPVTNIVDWDGDGLEDIVVGNSEGRLLFFKNIGTTAVPAFASAKALSAGDEEIHVQPGARGSIQGPAEANWGYLSPTVVDWNGDGLLDVVASSSIGEHFVWINVGSRTQPRLRSAQTLLMDGLALHGSWRVQPAAKKFGEVIAYLALDDDDQLHLYWRLDDRHLSDGGKCQLEDGAPISFNYLAAGGTGRAKLSWVDWDGDGRMDVLIGTSTHGSVPDPKNGLPQSLGRHGAAVLLLKNVGTNAEPIFRRPAIVTYRGKPIYAGQHECGASLGNFGQQSGLIVGRQDGRLLFFERAGLGLGESETAEASSRR